MEKDTTKIEETNLTIQKVEYKAVDRVEKSIDT